MDDFINSLSKLTYAASAAYVTRGGTLQKDGDFIGPRDLAAPDGYLGALIWMAHEFLSEFAVPFVDVQVVVDERASIGYRVNSVKERKAGRDGLAALAFSDFLRKEVFGEHVAEVDVGPLVANFQAWCEANAPAPKPPRASKRTPPQTEPD